MAEDEKNSGSMIVDDFDVSLRSEISAASFLLLDATDHLPIANPADQRHPEWSFRRVVNALYLLLRHFSGDALIQLLGNAVTKSLVFEKDLLAVREH